MSRYIPVDPDKWCEMVKALAEVEDLRKRCQQLQERVNDLEAAIIIGDALPQEEDG